MVAERAVGGSVQGHHARNLSNHLDKLTSTSTAQYQNLLEFHHSLDALVAANLAAAQGESCRSGALHHFINTIYFLMEVII